MGVGVDKKAGRLGCTMDRGGRTTWIDTHLCDDPDPGPPPGPRSLCKWTPECNIMALILVIRLFQYNPDMTLHPGTYPTTPRRDM